MLVDLPWQRRIIGVVEGKELKGVAVLFVGEIAETKARRGIRCLLHQRRIDVLVHALDSLGFLPKVGDHAFAVSEEQLLKPFAMLGWQF